MNVLEHIKSLWESSDALATIVPGERVHIGPVNPGMPAPSVSLVAATVARTTQSSTALYEEVRVDIEMQAESPELIEAVRDAIEDNLQIWTSDRYHALRMTGCTVTYNRQDTSPSKLWKATLSVSWEVYRV